MVLVDSNVLTDVFTEDESWFDWSSKQLAKCREGGLLAVNPIIFSEISPNFDSYEQLDEALPPSDYRRLALPYEAGFIAAQAFISYRKRGGQKRPPLPDFYIGAHAELDGLTLLTRDVARYKTYFPRVKLIAPG